MSGTWDKSPAGKKYRAEWYQRNKDRIRVQYRAQQREYERKTWYKKTARRYKTTEAVVLTLFSRDCEICGNPANRKHLDHNHTTGQIRGCLCSRCNTRLAAFEEPDWLRLAVKYLQRDEHTLQQLKEALSNV